MSDTFQENCKFCWILYDQVGLEKNARICEDCLEKKNSEYYEGVWLLPSTILFDTPYIPEESWNLLLDFEKHITSDAFRYNIAKWVLNEYYELTEERFLNENEIMFENYIDSKL